MQVDLSFEHLIIGEQSFDAWFPTVSLAALPSQATVIMVAYDLDGNPSCLAQVKQVRLGLNRECEVILEGMRIDAGQKDLLEQAGWNFQSGETPLSDGVAHPF